MSKLKIAVALIGLMLPAVGHADQTVSLSSLDLSVATQGWGKPMVDKSVGGNTMSLGGQTFAHGFGTHSPGVLLVALDSGSTRFQATVGIDDEVGGGKGTAEFEVVGDEQKILWRSGAMHEGDTPKVVDVDVTGVKTLILRVTAPGQTNSFDHDDWADARLTGTGPMPHTFAMSSPEPTISYVQPPNAPIIRLPFEVGVHPATPIIWRLPVTGERPVVVTAKGLPSGVTLDSATGIFQGEIGKPGDYPVNVTVKNRAGSAHSIVHFIAGDTIALTPPMGWNSYDAYGDDVTESEILANAKVVESTLQPYGWDTVTVDFRWYDPGASLAPNNPNARAGAVLSMDQYGRLVPAVNRFPSAANGVGFKALADEIHAMGLKFGIHIMRGIPRLAVSQNLPIDGSTYHAADAADTSSTCPWCPDMYGVRGDTPAGQAYYDSIIKLYASWGVDFIKMDDTSRPYYTNEISAVHSAIEMCGRTIIYSLSPGETPLGSASHVEANANMWRMSDDFWDGWGALTHAIDLDAAWQVDRGPGHWPDSDMLPLGHLSVMNRSVGSDRKTRFTKAEQVTMMSMWCIQPAPLILGAALVDDDAWTTALLTNPEVIAVDQDTSGQPARRVWSSETSEIWARKLSQGRLAVCLLNRDDLPTKITAKWADLVLKGPHPVRDLWTRQDVGIFDDNLSLTVEPHSAKLLVIGR